MSPPPCCTQSNSAAITWTTPKAEETLITAACGNGCDALALAEVSSVVGVDIGGEISSGADIGGEVTSGADIGGEVSSGADIGGTTED